MQYSYCLKWLNNINTCLKHTCRVISRRVGKDAVNGVSSTGVAVNGVSTTGVASNDAINDCSQECLILDGNDILLSCRRDASRVPASRVPASRLTMMALDWWLSSDDWICASEATCNPINNGTGLSSKESTSMSCNGK